MNKTPCLTKIDVFVRQGFVFPYLKQGTGFCRIMYTFLYQTFYLDPYPISLKIFYLIFSRSCS